MAPPKISRRALLFGKSSDKSPEQQKTQSEDLIAVPQSNCLSIQGITCRSCGDVCDERAVRFQLATAGRAIPQVDISLCNGCGACQTVCPEKAIRMEEAA